MVGRPALLRADEPTGNLDEAQSERLMQLLHELNRLDATVLIATHVAARDRSLRCATASRSAANGGG